MLILLRSRKERRDSDESDLLCSAPLQMPTHRREKYITNIGRAAFILQIQGLRGIVDYLAIRVDYYLETIARLFHFLFGAELVHDFDSDDEPVV